MSVPGDVGGSGMANVPYVWKCPEKTPKATGDEVFLPECNWRLFRSLPKFDMRNGEESDACSMIIKATIPEWSKWVPVANLAPVDASSAIDAHIVSTLHHVQKNAPTGMNAEVQRKVSIVLGAARATMTTQYRITESDLIPGEVAEPVLKAVEKADGDLGYVLMNPAATDAEIEAMHTLVLTPTEQAVVAKMALVGLGVPAMQGYSLIMTGHHYLSDKTSPSNRVTLPPEKAYLQSADVKEWWATDQDALRDALWHKSGHPIQMQLKESIACDGKLPMMLQAAGAGACASRLPAQESELRTANSYLTVLNSVRPAFESFKGSVDTSLLSDVVEVVKSYPVSRDPISDEFLKMLPEFVPADRRTRRSALQWLGEVLEKNSDVAAICYGFYCAMSEQAQMIGGVIGGDTLKASYSLTKLRTQNMSSYMVGTSLFQDYNTAKNAIRQRGEWVAPKYVTYT